MGILGDIIGGVSDLVGGHLDRKAQRQANEQNAAAQREFAQHGVRWKVEDAKAAGVHPLFALGASTQGYTPSAVAPSYDDIGRAGQRLGNALSSSQTTEQRLASKAQLRVLESEVNKNDAEASQARSAAMLNLQTYSQPPFPGQKPDAFTDPVSGAHVRAPSPLAEFEGWPLDDGSSRQRSGGQALAQGWQDYNFGDGPVTLFRGDPDQLMSDLQDMDAVTRAAIVAENTKRGQLKALMRLIDPLGEVSKQKGKEYGKQWGGYNPYVAPTYPRGRVRDSW